MNRACQNKSKYVWFYDVTHKSHHLCQIIAMTLYHRIPFSWEYSYRNTGLVCFLPGAIKLWRVQSVVDYDFMGENRIALTGTVDTAIDEIEHRPVPDETLRLVDEGSTRS